MNDGARVGIVGAGVAGTGAAWALSRAGISSHVMEKSAVISGRAATRRRKSLCFDYGANFFRLEDPLVREVVMDLLPSHDLVEIPGDVWTFSGDGRITPGDANHNAVPKFTYRRGINTLGKLLLESSPHAKLMGQTNVVKVCCHSSGWLAVDNSGKEHGPFEKLLLAIPAPQAAELLRESEIERNTEVVAACSYDSQYAFVYCFDERLTRSQPWHALVNTDGRHSIAWLSVEDDKPGHVPADKSVLVVQMTHWWSAQRLGSAPHELQPEVLNSVRLLLQDNVPEPAWWDSKRWLFAQPSGKIDATEVANLESTGIFLAGDALAGKGRVPLALKSGIETGERMAKHLRQDQQP